MKSINLKKIFTSLLFCALVPSYSLTSSANDAVSSLPELGSTAGTVLTRKQSNEIGSAFVRQARAQLKFINDPILLDYINKLGNKLVKAAVPGTEYENQKFTFHLIENPQLNAFAVPGGQIFIHSGLILDSKTESELAGIIAHEIAHVTENHGARGIENSRFDGAIILASVLVALASGNAEAAQAAISLGQGSLIQKGLNFTRGFEREADNKAVITMNRAGYDPSALAGFLRTLNRQQNLSSTNPPAFLLTHPLNDERIVETELRARAYPALKQPPESALAFRDFQAAIAIQYHADPNKVASLYRLNRNAFQDSSDHYKYGLALTKLSRFTEAETQLKKALSSNPTNLYYLIALSELDVARKDYSAATKRYEDIKAKNPEIYKKVDLYHAYTLITSKANQLAIPILRNTIKRSPNNPDARILISRAYGETGQLYQSYKARAEYHYLLGNLGFAIKQLENATSVAPSDAEKKHLQLTKAQYRKEKIETERILKKL